MRPPGVGVPSTGATLGAGSWQSGTGRAAPGPRGLGFGRADRQGGRNFREWPPRSEHPAPSPAATRPSVWVCVCAWSAHHRPHTSGGLPLALASPLMAHKSQGRGRAHGSMAAPLGGWHTRFLIAHLGSGSTLLIYRMDADLGGGSRGSKSPSCDHRAGNSRWGRWATGLPCPPLVLATKGCRGLLRSQCLQSGSCRDFGHPASPCLSSWTAAHPWPAASRGHR